MEVLLVNLQQSRNNIVEAYVSNIQMSQMSQLSQMSNNKTDIHVFTSNYMVCAWSNIVCGKDILRPI